LVTVDHAYDINLLDENGVGEHQEGYRRVEVSFYKYEVSGYWKKL